MPKIMWIQVKKNQQNDSFASIEADQKPFDIIIFSDSYNKEESWL